MKTTPLVKGLITGILIAAVTFAFTRYSGKNDAIAPFLVYGLYAGGICWTVRDYSRSPAYTGKFGDIFGQAFRCFIIVTLVMAVYTGVYGYTHPELAEEMGKFYKETLIKEKVRTPAEIEEAVAKAKKSFVTGNVSITVFGTLILGVLFTVVATTFVTIMRRKK